MIACDFETRINIFLFEPEIGTEAETSPQDTQGKKETNSFQRAQKTRNLCQCSLLTELRSTGFISPLYFFFMFFLSDSSNGRLMSEGATWGQRDMLPRPTLPDGQMTL